jgi:hypothetical protein
MQQLINKEETSSFEPFLAARLSCSKPKRKFIALAENLPRQNLLIWKCKK